LSLLGEVRAAGFTAPLLACAYDTQYRDGGLIYLNTVTDSTTADAIWASFQTPEAKRGGCNLGVSVTNMEKVGGIQTISATTYRTVRGRLPGGMENLAIIVDDATTAAGPSHFYLVANDDGVPPGFFPMLSQRLSIPLCPQWGPALWKRGLNGCPAPDNAPWGWNARKTIIPVESIGCRSFRVECDTAATENWLYHLREEMGWSHGADSITN
jgi:hypothetical protein